MVGSCGTYLVDFILGSVHQNKSLLIAQLLKIITKLTATNYYPDRHENNTNRKGDKTEQDKCSRDGR